MTPTMQSIAAFLGTVLGFALVAWKLGPKKLRTILAEALALHRAQEVLDVTAAVRAELKDLVREVVRAELGDVEGKLREVVRAELAPYTQRLSALEGRVEVLQSLLGVRLAPASAVAKDGAA